LELIRIEFSPSAMERKNRFAQKEQKVAGARTVAFNF